MAAPPKHGGDVALDIAGPGEAGAPLEAHEAPPSSTCPTPWAHSLPRAARALAGLALLAAAAAAASAVALLAQVRALADACLLACACANGAGLALPPLQGSWQASCCSRWSRWVQPPHHSSRSSPAPPQHPTQAGTAALQDALLLLVTAAAGLGLLLDAFARENAVQLAAAGGVAALLATQLAVALVSPAGQSLAGCCSCLAGCLAAAAAG